MSSLFRSAPLALLLLAVSLSAHAAQRELRVCAEPNNLPYSNQKLEGFENRIGELVARDLNAKLTWEWWAERRGFVRKTLKKGECDVVLGLPVGMPGALTTRPYYRSSYVFVSRKDRGLHIRSFDDPALRNLRIGVHILGEDYAPPGVALQRRNLMKNIVGYSAYGDYAKPNPPAALIDAVVRGEVDVAVVWGPIGGFFASRQKVPLDIVNVSPAVDPPALPMTFEMAMAVAPGNTALRDQLQQVLDRHRAEIDHILADYSVPRVPLAGGGRR